MDRVEVVVERSHVDRTVGANRRRADRATGRELPLEAAAGGDRIEVVVIRADVDRTVRAVLVAQRLLDLLASLVPA